ncbi:uncharacterized protein L3040_006877 [Drepanopeziza brunnea f. sp. 'multigermtubi']|uniref:2EXR domain-containing protein n=1 Tax=Marssonina brunnea f. sp. multigermtubi (strain MB_m1) TaxID=1072389 RepID=K1WIS4_MARBU|nr:uncharacterized protein MBM_08955 [Drepanopeziza brunnea f. sp. 'multigermtubi' MB_m1]EKD12726.1 hypothetical protein MBM_08955 [Drepanopeziza brunnea f. sp. 'multigermtubi' MB_m1]KAJ5038003.1 hypothetical protein L3040_006877 [Drepanopeziza brunnea f. sp. 'multigermtubi']
MDSSAREPTTARRNPSRKVITSNAVFSVPIPSVYPPVDKKYKVYDINSKDAFVLFPKLPPELRRMIWRCTYCDPKIVTIFNSGSDEHPKVEASYDVPVALRINFESREYAIQCHQLAFANNLGGNPVYFKCPSDALVIDGTSAMREFIKMKFQSINGIPRWAIEQPLQEKILVLGLYNIRKSFIPCFLLGQPLHIVVLRKSGPAPRRHVEWVEAQKRKLVEGERRRSLFLGRLPRPLVLHIEPLNWKQLQQKIDDLAFPPPPTAVDSQTLPRVKYHRKFAVRKPKAAKGIIFPTRRSLRARKEL